MKGATNVTFATGRFGPWDLDVLPSVYPPREDTALLCTSLSRVEGKGRKALEIGCGTGVVSMALAEMGWKVEAYDINPFAVSCSRANVEKFGYGASVKVSEGGLGEHGWCVPDDVELVVWNLPYLTPPEEDEPMLEPMEEASMSDLPGRGWSYELLKYLNTHQLHELVVVALFRTDPESPSRTSDWSDHGWSCRKLDSIRIGDERLGVFALWKTGFGVPVVEVEACDSTMDYAIGLPGKGWQRVITDTQKSGRGRRGSTWESKEGDLIASWRINMDISEVPAPGLLQISIGAVISDLLNCDLKWPNDLVSPFGGKIGGILIEASSSNRGFRLGIGINSTGRIIEGTMCPGWRDTLGDFSRDYIFNAVDSRVSSIIEGDDRIPESNSTYLQILSWRALSRSLSRGVSITYRGKEGRVIGIDSDGFIHIESSGERVVLSGTDELDWSFHDVTQE